MTDIDDLSIDELNAHRETLRLARCALAGRGAIRPGHPDHERWTEITRAGLAIDARLGELMSAGAAMPPEADISAALRAAEAARQAA
ncbi:MAG: hypothetical protein Q8K13_10455 [Parvibaculum sp.]|uniref:hypothetical protein n=1 Tax=Parvibaculum sp. TaxID=2024848 RepID=UPI00272F28DD|nr:hypothetical protein [Parvibaculum sp.]MDP2150049.1 hypothetical protein [Parvibaculum sp.]